MHPYILRPSHHPTRLNSCVNTTEATFIIIIIITTTTTIYSASVTHDGNNNMYASKQAQDLWMSFANKTWKIAICNRIVSVYFSPYCRRAHAQVRLRHYHPRFPPQ